MSTAGQSDGQFGVGIRLLLLFSKSQRPLKCGLFVFARSLRLDRPRCGEATRGMCHRTVIRSAYKRRTVPLLFILVLAPPQLPCGGASFFDRSIFDRDQCLNVLTYVFCSVAATRPRLGGEAMATAADYRKWAEECFEWARQASDESVREQYASLGRVWLDYAARAELRSGAITSSDPKVA